MSIKQIESFDGSILVWRKADKHGYCSKMVILWRHISIFAVSRVEARDHYSRV